MKSEEFDWRGGTVTYWQLEAVSAALPFVDQVDELKEDLAQVHYADGTILDMGWYPEFSKKGALVVLVIRDGAWEAPAGRFEARSHAELVSAVRSAVNLACRR